MNYTEMSDFEINKRVAKFWCENYDSVTQFDETDKVFIDYISSCEISDYCNIPNDAWPIVEANKIAIINDNHEQSHAYALDSWPSTPKGGRVEAFIYKHQFTDTNPFRAAMIVYLMIKESENE